MKSMIVIAMLVSSVAFATDTKAPAKAETKAAAKTAEVKTEVKAEVKTAEANACANLKGKELKACEAKNVKADAKAATATETKSVKK